MTMQQQGTFMTVRELMELLGTYPQDVRVVVNGYEDGYDDLSPRQIFVARIALNTGTDDWEGRHSDVDDASAGDADASTIVDALVLRRVSN